MARNALSALAFVGFLVGASISTGQEVVSASPDVTIELGSGVVTSDEAVAADNQLGVVMLENLGTLPGSAEVTAFGLALGGDRLFSLDTTADLGGLIARPADVIRYDGATYTTEFDGSSNGVPDGVRVDAVSIAPTGLLLSFDTTVSLPGSVVAADEDLVEFDATGGTFSIVLDGSAAGADTSLDADAGQDRGFGVYLVSFDTGGSVGGVVFDDEDVLEYDGSTWTMSFDASAADSDWAAADLQAVMVPEAGTLVMLAWGTLGAAGLAGLRRRTRSRA